MWEIKLLHNNEISLSRQIFLFFKERILSAQLSAGEAMPSTRVLAKELDVARNTVCEAYDMLWTEGFIISRQGAPSRVAEGLHIDRNVADFPIKQTKKTLTFQWDFKTGQPDLSLFPYKLWSRFLHEAVISLPVRELAYSGPKGYEPLCVEIAHWLLRSRGMKVAPEDVFITSGATQALHLLVDILHKKGYSFALENPSHPGIHTVIADKGYPLQWVPVDSQGADISFVDGQKISAVYVTPSHQFPLGGILTAGRRTTLIHHASENGFYIIEDDYDSDFRYTGPPISPLYSLDPSHVIYVGTFSKTIFPALRLGFAVLPKPLHVKWEHARNYMDVQNPVLEQATLAKFLRERKMDRHVRSMRKIYGEKRMILLQSVQSVFGNSSNLWGDASGLHVVLQFPGMAFGKQFEQDCRKSGIRINTVAQYCPGRNEHQDKLLLGYGHLNSVQIREGIKALHQIIAPIRK